MFALAAAVMVTMTAAPQGEAQSTRDEPIGAVRFHGEVSLLGGGGISGVPSIGAGPGVHLEAGLVLGGDSVISARASFATIVLLTVMQFGASYAHFIGERFTLGVGATWGGLIGATDLPGSLSFQVPLRATYSCLRSAPMACPSSPTSAAAG